MRVRRSTSEADRVEREEARLSGIPQRLMPISAGAAAAGALGGAVLGTFGGPIGIVLGAIVGAVGGMVIGDVVNQIREHHRAHDEQLDKDIGVTGGDIGAAWDPPPALAGDAVPDEGPSPKAG